MRESSCGSSFSPRSTTLSSTARAAPTENEDFLSRLPEPATKHDCSGSSNLIPVDDDGIFLMRVCELRTRSSPPPGVGLGDLFPSPRTLILVGSLSALWIFAIFTRTGHIRGLMTSLLLLGDSLLVYLPPSPPSIVVPAAGKKNSRRHGFRFAFCRAL